MSETLTEKQSEQKQLALSHPIEVPVEFKGYLDKFMAQVGTDFLVKEAEGWRENRFATAEPVETQEAGRVTYGDLATVGPIFEGLSDGTYIFLFGFYGTGGNATGDDVRAVLSINNSIQNEDFMARFITDAAPGEGGAWTVAQYSIANDNNNEVKMVYKSSDTSMKFEKRWLHGVKIHLVD